MSPLQRWMREHGYPGWYSWIVVVLAPLMASIGVLTVSLQVNERSIARERAERRAAEQAFCGIVVLLDDSYRRTPPTAPAGVELAEAIRKARMDYRCSPPK